jgi:hypothetical protein
MPNELEALRDKLKGAPPAETLVHVFRDITKWPGDPELRIHWRMLIVGVGIPRVALAMSEAVTELQCVTSDDSEAAELHNMGFPTISEEFLGLIPGDDLPDEYDCVIVLCDKEKASYLQYVQHGYQFLGHRRFMLTLVPIDGLLVNDGEAFSELLTFYEDESHRGVSMVGSFDAGMLSVTCKPEDTEDDD